ncbi:MAG: branched-chain amino acid ABC transporter permease [Acidimicrobiales bacterium]
MTSVDAPAPLADAAPGPAGPRPGSLPALLGRIHLPRQPLLRHLPLMVVGGVFFYFFTSSLSSFNQFQLGEIAVYVIALAGLSVLTGLNGQISLGHGAFVAVGAYTVAVLMNHTHLNLVVELVIALLVAAAFGVVVGIPAARLSGAYLAGVTLMLALALPQVAAQYGSVFGGEQGLTITPPIAPGSIGTEKWLAWIQIFCALVVLLLLANLVRSRFGRAFRAVRDDEVAAQVSGIHVARTKVLAFAVSAACAGLAGALLALSTGVVNTGEFPLSLSIGLLAVMVLGGAGSLVGVWWGAIILVYIPHWSTSVSHGLSLGNSAAAYLADAFFGVVLIVAMLVAPAGIQGGFRRLARWAWAAFTGQGLVKGPGGPSAGGPLLAAVAPTPTGPGGDEPGAATDPAAGTPGGAPAGAGAHVGPRPAPRTTDHDNDNQERSNA